MLTSPSSRRAFLLAASAATTACAAGAQPVSDPPANHPHQSLDTAETEKQTFAFLALKMFVEVDSDNTNGAVAVVRVWVPPGQGAAPHVHTREDEIHTVLKGHYRYRHGDVEVDAPAGTTIFMPRGIPHTFRNIGDTPGEHLVTAVPGGLEKLFREVSAADVQLPRDKAKFDAIYAKYGMTSLPPSALPLSTG